MYEPNIGYAIVLLSKKYTEDEGSIYDTNQPGVFQHKGVEGKIVKLHQYLPMYAPDLKFNEGDIVVFSNLSMISLEGKFAAIKISDIVARKTKND